MSKSIMGVSLTPATDILDEIGAAVGHVVGGAVDLAIACLGRAESKAYTEGFQPVLRLVPVRECFAGEDVAYTEAASVGVQRTCPTMSIVHDKIRLAGDALDEDDHATALAIMWGLLAREDLVGMGESEGEQLDALDELAGAVGF